MIAFVQSRKTNSLCEIELNWPGKSAAAAQFRADPRGILSPVGSKSINFETTKNLIIEGDNLDALKLLQTEYASKIRAIYIDPPYNTGNGFVYHDRRNHAAWLSMMMPRLMLARELLSQDGAIFISIDDHEIDKLRILMSEIFGDSNFVAQITIQSNPRGRQSEKHFATVHEYVLVYAKDHASCNLRGHTLTEDQLKEFSERDNEGRRYRLLGLRQRGAASLREDRPAMHYPIYVDPATKSISLDRRSENDIVVLPKKSTGQAGRWMWGATKARDSIHLLEARLISRRNEWDIFVRDYLDDSLGTPRKRKSKTIWDDKDLNYQNGKRELKQLLDGEAPVDYPKPLGLLKRIIDLIDDPQAIYLDFFAGTGTLGQAVIESNTADGGTRNFILVQSPESLDHSHFKTIADVCHKRIQLVCAKHNSGFKYLRVN